MASGDTEKPRCRVCKTVFTFTGPEPLLLPCLHPACKPCVDSTGENITCTTCQQLFSTARDVFPKHFILSKDLFKLTLKQKPSDILCTFRNNGARADRWCPKCDAFLCITCLEFHKDIKSTRSHVVESLQNYLDQVNDGVNSFGFCTIHQEYPFEFFDSSCGCLVCYKCLKHDHSTCRAEDITVAFDKMKDSELDNNIGQIVSRLDVITELEQEAHDMVKKLDENYKRVNDEVISTFSDIRAGLDMREKILLQETSESFKDVQNVNTERIEALKQEKTRCEAALRFMKKSKEITDPVQALMMKKTIDERTKVCTEADLQKIDGRESSICLSTQDLRDIKQSIETFAGLYSVYDEDTIINPGLTTREIHNKTMLELEKKVEACHKILQDIQQLSDESHNQGEIKLEIPGVSGIKSPCQFFSESKNIRNMPWILCAKLNLQNDATVLGLYLYTDFERNASEEWKCDVAFTFEITSSELFQSKRRDLYRSYTFTERIGYGISAIIPTNELLDPTMGFVQDDCIRVSVDVTIQNTTGVPAFEQLVKKICKETLDKMNSSLSDSDCDDDSECDDGSDCDDDEGDDNNDSEEYCDSDEEND